MNVLGLLGPNGSGKTTLIFYVYRRAKNRPESGKILLNKKSIEESSYTFKKLRKGLGYLPQQRSVFDMSVYDNILGYCSNECIKDP